MCAVAATEPEGYWYGSNDGLGITVFEMDPAQTTSKDEIAFGFMTWRGTGTLLRVDGDQSSGHFIQAQLVIASVLMFICINLQLLEASSIIYYLFIIRFMHTLNHSQ